MDLFATLGVALGLAMLAGLNLYLTIFVAGLSVKLGWFGDPAVAAALEGFGHPAVIAVSLGLFIVQFIVDKVPWLDSLWDSIHTFLKPAGGVLIALTSLGPDAGTMSQVFVAALALTGSLLTHGVKAGTRLTINTTPEPFSNIGASVVEDMLVIGGFALIANHPTTAFFVFVLVLAGFIYLTPRVTRAIRAILWLIWKKLRVPAGDKLAKKQNLPNKLSAEAESLLLDEFGSEKYKVAWCLPCVCGKTRNAGRLCRNLFGHIISIRERPGQLFFYGSRNFKKFVEKIDLGGAIATHESHFISEGIVINNKRSKLRTELRFHRGQGEIAERVTDYLQDQIATEDRKGPEEPAEPGAEEAAEAEDQVATGPEGAAETASGAAPTELPEEDPGASSPDPGRVGENDSDQPPTPEAKDDGETEPPAPGLSPLAPLSPLGSQDPDDSGDETAPDDQKKPDAS